MSTLPSRPANALPGSQFMQSLEAKDSGNRDDLITSEILRGNVPDFMHKFVPITITEGGNTLIYYVAPDYLCLGTDQDYVRVPLGAQAAQRIADAFGCTLPSAKMSNQIWQAAAAKVPPKPMSGITSNIGGQTYSPTDFLKTKMTDTDSFVEHNRLIQQQLAAHKLGDLVAGHKKDVVVSNQLAQRPGKVAIHGLHNTKGQAIQGGSWGHDINYRDYSHGIRMVDKFAKLNGKNVNLQSVMQDPKYAALVSDEGALKFVAYNYNDKQQQQVATAPKQPLKTDDLVSKIDTYLDQITKLI